MFDALLAGLDDYTTDERGDVGSWIRIACVKGLATAIALLLEHARAPALTMPDALERYLPPARFHAAVGGIMKQAVERLDNVRQHAGEQLLRVLALPRPHVASAEQWAVCGEARMRELLLR